MENSHFTSSPYPLQYGIFSLLSDDDIKNNV